MRFPRAEAGAAIFTTVNPPPPTFPFLFFSGAVLHSLNTAKKNEKREREREIKKI